VRGERWGWLRSAGPPRAAGAAGQHARGRAEHHGGGGGLVMIDDDLGLQDSEARSSR